MRKFSFYARYVRSFFFRNRPVVCHYFATERCNLECPYCCVSTNPRPEADFAATKEIIRRVARMGVANLSITGGEPLLRKDIFEIIRFASTQIPYIRITSNGTLPRKMYEQLLATPVDGFSISVDAVTPKTVKHDKCIERSFEAIDYLFKNRGERRMNLSTTFYGDNVGELQDLIDYCDRTWPGLGIFIQPVVVGKGNLRAQGQRVDPAALFELSKAPNVSNTESFNRICQEYFTDPDFEFRCRAGRLFFGIRPDGEFWACHDVKTPLNILDDLFFEKYKALDFDAIADPQKCGSCIYSCYINLQKGIEQVSFRSMFDHFTRFSRSFGSRSADRK